MNSRLAKADRRANPVMLGVKALIAVAIAAWCVGFFVAGGATKKADARGGAVAVSVSPAQRVEAGGSAESADSRDAETPEQRRERVLSALLATMRQSDDVRLIRGDASAVAKLGPEDIQAALELVLKQGDDERWMLVPQIVARWAEFDPKAAADYVLGLGNEERWKREEVISCVLTQWAAKDPASAKAWSLALPAGRERDEAIYGVAGGMQNDPAAALEWAKSLPDEARPERLYFEIFARWAERDSVSASQQALAMPAGEHRELALTAVAYRSAEKDPQSALGLLLQVPISRRGYLTVVEAIFGPWAANDPDAAMTAASAMPEGGGRNFALGTILAKVALKSEAELTRLLQEIPGGPSRAEVIQDTARLLGLEKPDAAAKLALTLPEGKDRDSLISGLARGMNPADGLAFMKEHLPEAAWKEGTQEVLKKWSLGKPYDALMWMMKSQSASAEEVGFAIFEWSRSEPQTALAWAKSQPEGEQKANLLSGAIQGLAFSDPLQAAELLTTLPPGDAKKEAAHRIAGAWAPYDPEGAAEWAVQIPDQPSREAAMERVTQAMVQADIAGTGAWLNSLPASSERDASVAAYAKIMIDNVPEDAATFAATISDSAKREAALRDVYSDWTKINKTAAKQWLASTPSLSAAEKKRIEGK